MTTASPEKVAPVSQQAVVETTAPTTTPSGGPMAPVPLAPGVGTLTVGPAQQDGGRRADAPLGRLRRLGPPGGAPFPDVEHPGFAGVPGTLADLLECNDTDIVRLAALTAPKGGLTTILKGAFEADWFRAKACLVFGKWPGGGEPKFGHQSALDLMTGFTRLRGNVHTEVKTLALARVKTELIERGKVLEGNTKLRDRMASQTGLEGNDQVEFKGSVGADSVTSDVDVSTGGQNSELAIRAYNDEFRTFLGLQLDPGTVFDLNVYAKDFIFGWNDNAEKTVVDPKRENKEKPSPEKANERDREQDIWALVHVARYMPDDGDWDAFVAGSLRALNGPQKADQQERLSTARRRAKGFEWRLLSMMAELCTKLDLGIGTSDDVWGKESEHYEEGALKMRAANKLYEDKLLQVKDLRSQIEVLRKDITDGAAPGDAPKRLEALIAKLSGELSMAQLYANEVYGSGGATVHAVIGMQIPKKLTKERGHAVTADLPKQEWYQSFTDNLGDVLKDFEHYGKDDFWYAAFKMGKYAHRMVDCVGHLSDGSPDDVITPGDAKALADNPHVVALRELAKFHLEEKDGDGGRDPMTLKDHKYFGKMTSGSVASLRDHAIGLGMFVRSMAARKGPASAVPTRPTRGADITPKQLALASAAVRDSLATTRQLAKAAEGPAAD
jgi:hypothetical protein